MEPASIKVLLTSSIFLVLYYYPVELLYWSAGAAITKYHRLRGLDDRRLFLTVLEVAKFKINVLANVVPGEGLLPGLQMATFLLYLHMAERGESLTLPLFLQPLIPS